MGVDTQELKALALQLLPQAAMIVDGEGRIIVRNTFAEAMLLPGSQAAQVLHAEPADLPDWPDSMAALQRAGGNLTYQNVSMAGADGRQLTVDVCLFRLAEGSPGGAVLVLLTDVSQRVTMQRELAISGKMAGLGAVAAQIAHELNNPLDGVMRYLGLAQRSQGARAADYLDKAREGLQRMAEIIRDLRGAAGRRGTMQTGPIARLLDQAVEVMQPRCGALGVTVVCDVDEAANIPVDAGLFQVFCNVIKNALDAMPSGGRLNIRLQPADGSVVVEFADTGVGLPRGAGEEIFQPFYTTKPPGEGLGLGLSICREIVSRGGGTIVAAPRDGGGTTITIRLNPKKGREVREKDLSESKKQNGSRTA